jgi:hypothetical protein
MGVELSTCDECGIEKDTDDLVWITAEDFEPKGNELIPEGLYNKYDALCEECYLKLIKRR